MELIIRTFIWIVKVIRIVLIVIIALAGAIWTTIEVSLAAIFDVVFPDVWTPNTLEGNISAGIQIIDSILGVLFSWFIELAIRFNVSITLTIPVTFNEAGLQVWNDGVGLGQDFADLAVTSFVQFINDVGTSLPHAGGDEIM